MKAQVPNARPTITFDQCHKDIFQHFPQHLLSVIWTVPDHVHVPFIIDENCNDSPHIAGIPEGGETSWPARPGRRRLILLCFCSASAASTRVVFSQMQKVTGRKMQHIYHQLFIGLHVQGVQTDFHWGAGCVRLTQRHTGMKMGNV